jgi:hypothetical protein
MWLNVISKKLAAEGKLLPLILFVAGIRDFVPGIERLLVNGLLFK